MAGFEAPVPGSDALVEHLLQIILCLNGQDGYGKSFTLTNLTTDEYQLEIENRHSNHKAIRIRAGTVLIFDSSVAGCLISAAGEEASAAVNTSATQTLYAKTLDNPTYTGKQVWPIGSTITATGSNYTVDLSTVATRGKSHKVTAVADSVITNVLTTGVTTGTELTLDFDNSYVKIADGNNLDLCYDFFGRAGARLSLQFDGTNWVERYRSGDSPVGVEVYLSGNISIGSAAGGDTPISWTSSQNATGTPWVVGDPTKFTAPHTGRYRLEASGEYAANATGHRGLAWKKNAESNLYILDRKAALTDGTVTTVGGSETISLVAGDYVRVVPIQTSGAGLNIQGGATYQTRAAFRFVGR